MLEVTSVENMHKSDATTIASGITGTELMLRAAKGVFNSVSWKGRIAIVVGGGDNGGDGYALANILQEQGQDVHIYKVSEKLTADSQYYFNLAKKNNIEIFQFDKSQSFDGYDIIVDCIFGTGFRKEPTGIAKSAIEAINNGKYIVSVDINSGLNGDSGQASCAVKSDLTVSINTYKTGHFLNDAKDYIQQLVNVDIGIRLVDRPYYLLQESDFKTIFQDRKRNSHKGTYGKVVILGGSLKYSGAIKLAASSQASLCVGTGLSVLAVPQIIAQSIASYIIESTIHPFPDDGCYMLFDRKSIDEVLNKSTSIAVGMGWGQSKHNEKILGYILKTYDIPMVIDADGLNTLSKLDINLIRNKKIIITPHLKEFSRLIGVGVEKIKTDAIYYAKQFALDYGIIVLLKGTTTIVTDGREVFLTNSGTPGMAKAGSGDVLSGILAGINAFSNQSLLINATASAFINGKAGEYASIQKNEFSMLATDTVSNIYKAVNLIIKSRGMTL